PVVLLAAARCDPKASNRFVQDKENAMLPGKLLQAFEVAFGRWNHAHVRHYTFGDYSGDLPWVVLNGTLERGQVVPGDNNRVVEGVPIQAGTVCNLDGVAAQSNNSWRRWVRRHQDIVVPAVIVALELQYLRPAGVASRQADDCHHRLGSGVRKADDLGVGHDLPEQLGHFNFNFGGGGEMGARSRSLRDGLRHLRVRMSPGKRAESHHPVDIFVSVHVVQAGSMATLHEDRLFAIV